MVSGWVEVGIFFGELLSGWVGRRRGDVNTVRNEVRDVK